MAAILSLLILFSVISLASSASPSYPSMSSSSSNHKSAVVITILLVTIVAIIFLSITLLYFIRKLIAWLGHTRRLESSQSLPFTFTRRDSFKRFCFSPRGLVVDETGLDVLYWRKLRVENDARRERKTQADPLRPPGSLSSTSPVFQTRQTREDEVMKYEMNPVLMPAAPLPVRDFNSAPKPEMDFNSAMAIKTEASSVPGPSLQSSPPPPSRPQLNLVPAPPLPPPPGGKKNLSVLFPPVPCSVLKPIMDVNSAMALKPESNSERSTSPPVMPSANSVPWPPLPPPPGAKRISAPPPPPSKASTTPTPPLTSPVPAPVLPPPPGSKNRSVPPPPNKAPIPSPPRPPPSPPPPPPGKDPILTPQPPPPPTAKPIAVAPPPPPGAKKSTPPPPPPPGKDPILTPQPPPPPTAKPIPAAPPPPPGAKKSTPPPPPAPGKAPPVPPPPGKVPPQGAPMKPKPVAKLKGEVRSSSALPENSLDNESAAPLAKLKPLHWEKVPANADHSTVWDNLHDGSFRFDDDLMEALFGYKDTNTKVGQTTTEPTVPSKPNPPPANQATFLLDPRKSQNIAIVLRSLGLSRQAIADSLIHGKGLSGETLEKLARIALTEEEQSTILNHPAGDSAQLTDAESFLYHLLTAVPTAFRRVDAMLFRSNYEPEVLTLKKSLQTLELASKELRDCTLFFKLLEVVLKSGNRMNAGTERGNARAFNLVALRKLADVKSTDGKTTLLYFVVQEVVRYEGRRCVVHRNQSFRLPANQGSPAAGANSKEERENEYLKLGLPVVSRLGNDLANVKSAAGIDYESISGCCDRLGARMGVIRNFVWSLGGDGGEFKKEMTRFIDAAEAEMKEVKEEQKRVMESVKKTTEYYHSDASKGRTENLLQLFVIVKDFLDMVDRVCAEIRRGFEKKKSTGTASPPGGRLERTPARFENLPVHFLADNLRTSTDSDDDFEDD